MDIEKNVADAADYFACAAIGLLGLVGQLREGTGTFEQHREALELASDSMRAGQSEFIEIATAFEWMAEGYTDPETDPANELAAFFELDILGRDGDHLVQALRRHRPDLSEEQTELGALLTLRRVLTFMEHRRLFNLACKGLRLLPAGSKAVS